MVAVGVMVTSGEDRWVVTGRGYEGDSELLSHSISSPVYLGTFTT